MNIQPLNITTRTLHEHTAQQVFDFVCRKVIEQGHQSLGMGGCAYRGREGLKCAVGHLILDEDMPAVLGEAGVEIGSLDAFVPRVFVGLGWQRDLRGQVHYSLLAELQGAHDDYDTPDFDAPDDEPDEPVYCFVREFRRNARRVAEKFSLDASILDQVQPLEAVHA